MSQNKKILIAIPCKNDIEADTFKSIYDLIIPEGYVTEFSYFYGYAVDQVRNLIAHRAIQWDFDYIFWVDHDIVFAPDTLVKMISANKDIIAGIYRPRLIDEYKLEIYDKDFRNYLEVPFHNSIFEIGACGFGCVLTKIEVFKSVGYPYFVYHQAINHNDTFSEDIDFCSKAAMAGYRIFCDSSILCGHIGSYMFTVKPFDQQNRIRQLSNMALLPQEHVNYLQGMSDDKINPRVIYDIGSCVLHWWKRAREIWPDSLIIPFEAMDQVEFLYKENSITQYCVGSPLYSSDGFLIDFYENVEHPGGNSIYEENALLSPLAKELFEGKKITRVTRTLDSLIDQYKLPLPDLIKLDIQGAELEALKGATKALEHCTDIIIELQHVDYNIGAPKYEEVKEFLNNQGFIQVGGAFCASALGVDADYHFRKAKF